MRAERQEERGDWMESRKGLPRSLSTLSTQMGTKLECQDPKKGPQWWRCAEIHPSSLEQNKEFQLLFWN